MQLIARFTGSEDTENWEGKRIILYDDPSVSFGGKLTGGIRVREFKGKKVESAFDDIRNTNIADKNSGELEPF